MTDPFDIQIQLKDQHGIAVSRLGVLLTSERPGVHGPPRPTLIEEAFSDEQGQVRFEFSSDRARRYSFPLTLWLRMIEPEPRTVVLHQPPPAKITIEIPPTGELILQGPPSFKGSGRFINEDVLEARVPWPSHLIQPFELEG